MNRNLRNSTNIKPGIQLFAVLLTGCLILAGLFGIFTISNTHSALELHSSPTCSGSYVNHELIWSSSGSGGVDWPDGSLSQTFNNVDNSGVSFSFSYSGETSKLAVLGDQTPCITGYLNNYDSDALGHYVYTGFTGSGITLTIDITPAIPATMAFDFHHINGNSSFGDEVQVYAVPESGGANIYPTLTANGSPSWEDDGNGTADANLISTSSNNAFVGVNFNSATLVDQLIIIWKNCDICGSGDHGMSIGNIEFCSQSTTFPVEWLSVSAEMKESAGQIQWETTNEINADYYQIERQQKGSGIFETLGKIQASNTPEKVHSYRFTDQHVGQFGVGQEVIYRIKQVDKDGKFEYSKSVQLITGQQDISINLFPNPASDVLNIEISRLEAFQKLQILNMEGKSVWNKSISAGDSNPVRVDVSSWPGGKYILSLKGNGSVVTKNLIVR